MSDSDKVLDLAASTLNNFGRGHFNQIAQKSVDYPFWNYIFKRDRVKKQGGKGIQRQLNLKQSDSARATDVWETDNVKAQDIMTSMNIDWKYYDNSTAFDKRILEQNKKDPEALYSMLKAQDMDLKLGLIEKIEYDFAKPYSETSTKEFNGLNYWIVRNATDGFTGGAPGSLSTVAGVNPDNYTNFKNYSKGYTSSTDADSLLPDMEQAAMRSKFKSPVSVSDYSMNSGRVIFTVEQVIADTRKILKAQNSNLGFNADPISGDIMFNTSRMTWLEGLEVDSTNPVYMLDMDYWEFVSLSGYYFKSSGLVPHPDSHNAFAKFIDLAFNTLCTDRRRQSILYKKSA